MSTRGAARRGIVMPLIRPLVADAAQGAVGPRTTGRHRVPFAMGGHDEPR